MPNPAKKRLKIAIAAAEEPEGIMTCTLLPADLHEWIKADARKYFRSIAAHLRALVTEAKDRQGVGR